MKYVQALKSFPVTDTISFVPATERERFCPHPTEGSDVSVGTRPDVERLPAAGEALLFQ
jgi:hypothetical protein